MEISMKNRFSAYGRVLASGVPGGSQLVLEEEKVGWRIADLEFNNHAFSELSLHPNTKECFFPIEGLALLLVADKKTPEKCEFFLLDQPLMIKENIWHSLAAVSNTAKIIVAENADVQLVKEKLRNEISVFVNI